MENENPIRTLGGYSRPSHEGYQNTIELPDGNNVVPLRSNTIQLVQNRCSFHGLQSEDPNQHLKDFLKLVDSLDLDVANRERMRLHAFEPIKSLDKEEEMEEGTDGRSVKSMKEELTGVETKMEVLVETHRSRHIGYYLKYKINKKLIEGLVDNHKYNESFLAIRLGKMDHETYKSLPAKPMYDAVLKKKLVKKDDMEGYLTSKQKVLTAPGLLVIDVDVKVAAEAVNTAGYIRYRTTHSFGSRIEQDASFKGKLSD
ncbi:hypothetical protein Tco_0924786 [Tanacetum coccineum]|uniref:MAK10-like protein n=1 Tax=Tanacetum coccineum TaxID=301880 RepID=A0ABQ5D7L9_9ASTR